MVVVIVVALDGLLLLGTTFFFSNQSENLVLRNNWWRPRGEGGHVPRRWKISVWVPIRGGARATPQPKRNKK